MRLSTKKMLGGEYQVYLGAIKIAEIHYTGLSNIQGKVELSYSAPGPNSGPRVYETMLKAIGDLWHLLEQPVPEGAVAVSLAKCREEKEAADMRAALSVKPNTSSKTTSKKKKKAPSQSEDVMG